MATYRWVFDSRYLQADCQEPGSAPEPYARKSSTSYLYLYLYDYNVRVRYAYMLSYRACIRIALGRRCDGRV